MQSEPKGIRGLSRREFLKLVSMVPVGIYSRPLLKLANSDQEAGQKNIILWQGPWALFHLLDAGRDVDPDKKEATEATLRFTIGSRHAKLKFSAPSARTIIGGDLLHGFECPRLIEEKVAKQ